MHPVYIGCSGWNYRAWRGELYPDGLPARRWLEHYASRFDTVEVNATFYRLIARTAVENWVSHTPPGFVFAVKASRYLTHVIRYTATAQGAPHVIGGPPERTFQALRATAPWRYVRFHYGARGRDGNYSRSELEAWARRLHGWRAEGELFAYFNNDWEGFAVRNAQALSA